MPQLTPAGLLPFFHSSVHLMVFACIHLPMSLWLKEQSFNIKHLLLVEVEKEAFSFFFFFPSLILPDRKGEQVLRKKI